MLRFISVDSKIVAPVVAIRFGCQVHRSYGLQYTISKNSVRRFFDLNTASPIQRTNRLTFCLKLLFRMRKKQLGSLTSHKEVLRSSNNKSRSCCHPFP